MIIFKILQVTPKTYLAEIEDKTESKVEDKNESKVEDIVESKKGQDYILAYRGAAPALGWTFWTVQMVELAFKTCETDNHTGLTWAEVVPCKEKWGKVAVDARMRLPTKADFENYDTDGDGVIMFKEWHDKVKIENAAIKKAGLPPGAGPIPVGLL